MAHALVKKINDNSLNNKCRDILFQKCFYICFNVKAMLAETDY